jgi:putative flippase GtrA
MSGIAPASQIVPAVSSGNKRVALGRLAANDASAIQYYEVPLGPAFPKWLTGSAGGAAKHDRSKIQHCGKPYSIGCATCPLGPLEGPCPHSLVGPLSAFAPFSIHAFINTVRETSTTSRFRMSESSSTVLLRRAGRNTVAIQGARFVIVGLTATCTHVAIVVLLIDGMGLSLASLANAFALLAGSAVSYLGNYFWTFRSGGAHVGRVVRFAVSYGLVFAFGGLVMLLAADIIGMPYMLPLALIVVVSPILTFLLNRFWVFGQAA